MRQSSPVEHMLTNRSTNLDTWTWDQLRIMKVGGNASATEFFNKNGGAAALNSKDAKVKYTSRAALAYKDELKRRAANDAKLHPDEVIADDIGQQEDEKRKSEDFFESWDKPIVHKPTPPPSRTATPPVGRTPSPANGPIPANGKSTPINRSNLSVESAVPRTTTSSALRSSKPTTTTGARRTGVLGAKKPQRLAVKKASEIISFEEAEKAAKEEAERIEKWGADEVELTKPDPIKPTTFRSTAASPPSQPSTPSQTTRTADVGGLNKGMQRLGFGMIANAPVKTASPVKSSTPSPSILIVINGQVNQRRHMPVLTSPIRKAFRQISILVEERMIQRLPPKREVVYNSLMARHPYRQINTLVVKKRKTCRLVELVTLIWKQMHESLQGG